MQERWVHKVTETMRVPGNRRAFVLGCFERRVTLYSQQVRALNLVDALTRSREIADGASIAVVGGGVAGLTCAAGALLRGARVTVLEREDRVLSLLRYDPNRWLHPRVYDWPIPGWHHAQAGLPVLDWTAGSVESVREQLERGWSSIALTAGERLRVRCGVRDVSLTHDDKGPWLTWNSSTDGASGTERFALVVLAVGFGLEQEDVPEHRSYWHPDDLDETPGFRVGVDHPRRWLISGIGDGALTDLLRLRIRGFRHEQMVADFASLPGIDAIAAKIRELEYDVRAEHLDSPEFLFDEYMKLRSDEVIQAMRARARPDTRVTLNAPVPYYLQANSSALNRFLIAQLKHAGQFEFIPGTLQKPVEHAGAQTRVTMGGGPPRSFDRVVVRHGPKPALARDFPAVWDACEPLRQPWKVMPHLLDQTRERYWGDGAFGAETPFSEDPAAGTAAARPLTSNASAGTDVNELPLLPSIGRPPPESPATSTRTEARAAAVTATELPRAAVPSAPPAEAPASARRGLVLGGLGVAILGSAIAVVAATRGGSDHATPSAPSPPPPPAPVAVVAPPDAAPVDAVSAKAPLVVDLTVWKGDVALSPGATVRAGDTIAFQVKTSAPAYVYLVQCMGDDLLVLFPQDRIAIANPIDANAPVRIPERGGFKLEDDGVYGTITVSVVASPDPQPDLATTLHAIASQRGKVSAASVHTASAQLAKLAEPPRNGGGKLQRGIFVLPEGGDKHTVSVRYMQRPGDKVVVASFDFAQVK